MFDRLEKELQKDTPLTELMWSRREIENYFCSEEVLMRFATSGQPDDLFGALSRGVGSKPCRNLSRKSPRPLPSSRSRAPGQGDIKASDDFLTPLFADFSKRLKLPAGAAEKYGTADLCQMPAQGQGGPGSRKRCWMLLSTLRARPKPRID